MSKEHIAYFDKLILQKLESLPRAIEGNVCIKRLKQECLELRILKEAREHFYIKQLPNMTLEQAILKAKPNLDKITDVDKHLDDIR